MTKNEMTLRDYFAAQAMVPAMKHWRKEDADDTEDGKGTFNWPAAEDLEVDFWESPDIHDDCFEAAKLAYHMADAMMFARTLPSNATVGHV